MNNEQITAAECAELQRLMQKLHATVASMNQTGLNYCSIQVRVAESPAWKDGGFVAFVGTSTNMFEAPTPAELFAKIAESQNPMEAAA